MDLRKPIRTAIIWPENFPSSIAFDYASTTERARRLAYSLWLFTVSDLKTIVGPSTAFAILQVLGSSSFDFHSSNTTLVALSRIPLVVYWTWINLLAFNVDNQRHPDAIEEDRYNKPWRPLPSERMTAKQATIAMLILYPLTVLISLPLGTHMQSLALVALGIWHNDLGGGDTSWLIRNFLNACGFTSYLSGALQILLQQPVLLNPSIRAWLLTIGLIVLTTIHTQDMYDQKGDAQRNRQTAPLVLGDRPARWTIALPVLFWSCFCPHFWNLQLGGYVTPIVLGALVAWRCLTQTTVQDDRTTFKLWNVWLVILYTLPVVKSLTG